MEKLKGVFIVFEGIDGAGKSTQVRLLAERLRPTGREVVALREPTSGYHGQEIRCLAKFGRLSAQRERELFTADRREDVAQNIVPALNRGAAVVLDRYYFSTMAYQGAHGADPAEIRAENEAFAPQPHLLLILDLPVDEAVRRIESDTTRAQRDAFEESESLRKVKAVFDSLTDAFVARIDATQPPEAVAEQIWRRVEPLL